MEAPQMRGVEEPLLPEPRAVEGGATQSEGAIETQEARYPRLHKTAGLRSLDVWVEISKGPVKQLRCWEEVVDPHLDPQSRSRRAVLGSWSDSVGCAGIGSRVHKPGTPLPCLVGTG